MSYDCYIRSDNHCPHCGGVLETDDDIEDIGNMTSNVAGIWAEGLIHATGDPLAWMSRMWAYEKSPRCADIQPILDKALAYLEDPKNESQLRRLEPSNGWGSFEGAREYFRKITEACRRHPTARLYISS